MFSTSTTASRSSSCSSTVTSGMTSLLVSLPRGPSARDLLGLQVTVHEVDLLEPAKALADVLRTDLSDALDGFELGVGGRKHLVQAPELPHDLLDHELRQPRDAAEDPMAARGDGVVERVEL